ncbi:EAL domain-containing protein [Paraglaciecola aquimarina]|uniref:cyclic-guanylate-specific phosphodiesterase n=1 Tax=Paraglaciecola aquimarina TaxID=1235557 RepID=A0ABU3SX31_9ALTE|nr:EAL domain-containing protein [Paraglaciecola aquimarina]MDU0354477.1 EAL domain-containing protein [Paraglaciecola aquimarina]
MHKPYLPHKIAVSTIGICIGFSLFFFSYSHILQRQLAEQTEKIFQNIQNGLSNGFKVINSLHEKGFTQCSQQNLMQMRKAQFKSNDIRDIGFYQNGQLTCTTGSGKLANPITDSPENIQIDGNKIWFDHVLETFDESITGIVIRKNEYNVILTFQGLLGEYTVFKHYEIGARVDNQWLHLYGDNGIFKSRASDSKKYFSVHLLSHSVEFCSASGVLCVAMQQDNFSEFESSSLIFFAFLVALFSGISALYVYDQVCRYLFGINRRVTSGLKAKRFTPYYQAIVDLETNKVVGCELLARFKDKMGPLYPDQFIPVVGKLNLSWQLTEYLISTALQDFKHIQSPDEPFYLSINIFPKDINNQDILKGLARLQDLPPALNVAFEITEDEELLYDEVGKTLEALSNSPVQISIDDFGTGYSNLSQLKLLDIHTLKIDKSFVDEVETGSIRSTLIPNIVAIADKLEATIIAEGIENQLQVTELLKMNIKYGQGWYYSKAVPFNKFKEHLTANSHFKFSGNAFGNNLSGD